MAANKYLLADRSKLLKTKLSKIASNLQDSLASDEYQTKEQYLFEAIKVLNDFYKSLNDPRMEITDVRAGDIPDVDVYNTLWQQILDDLITVFTELENIETLTVANFNFVTTEANRLTARLKAVSSKLGDYILYSLNPTKDAFFFKDSFNDLSKIDINSALLNSTECEISQTEGIVTLPIDREKESFVVVKETPLINPNSNGIVGNNQELGAQYNGTISTILDNNPDTWFEYERVVTKAGDDKQPLVLDLTINLGDPTVINHIRLNPNNFGTKTVIQIDTIETSLDGQIYTSIKDDIPIAGFTTEDEENVFSLAPSTSKYAGQGLYTFTPRKVKYVHLVLKQSEPYVISTSSGERLRYAIGIRDIDIRSYVYENKGEIISTAFESQDEIRRALIQTNQNPSQDSELASINYFLSPDDGATWHQLQPRDFTGTPGIQSLPEILEFNGVSTNTINTAAPVSTLRLKAELVRNDENFEEGSSTLNKTKLTAAEVHPVPSSSPFTIELDESPVDGTVIVIDPLFGSRGDPESPYIIGHSPTDQEDKRKYRLPFKHFPRPLVKEWDSSAQKWYTRPQKASEFMHVEVGGEEWSHAAQPLDNYTNDWENWQTPGSLYKYYIFNVHEGTLEFGNNKNTVAPASDEAITMWFEPERLFPSAAEDNHVAKLDFHTSSNKNDMTIKRYDKIESDTEVLPKKATIIRLKHENISDDADDSNIVDVMSTIGNTDQKDFLNGSDELVDSGDWSIDWEAGIIYTYDPTPDTTSYSINYYYQPIYTLTEDDWDWTDTDILLDSVVIRQDAWKTRLVEDESITITTGMRVFDLSKLSIVKGTLDFALEGSISEGAINDEHNPFLKEVTYIDGEEEFGGQAVKTTEQIASHSGTGVERFYFSENIINDTEYEVLFSDPDLFDSITINRASGWYDLESSTPISNPGKVTYFYTNPNAQDNGLYSIDYASGKVHTQRVMDPDSQSDWTLTVSYEWTDYRAEYRIARLLDPKAYKVDITNGIVTIKDSEILKHFMLPHGRMDSRTPNYLVNYKYVAETREEIEELRDYFSPVIKDYAIKVLTKNRIY